MTKAITLRLDDSDHEALTRQADQLRVSPGTLARMLVHAGLNCDDHAGQDAKAAIARLVRRSRQRPQGDAVTLVDDARTPDAPVVVSGPCGAMAPMLSTASGLAPFLSARTAATA